MIKKILVAALTFAAVAFTSAAQQKTAADFQASYTRQVTAVGYDGIGVETILTKWEQAYPEDTDMLRGWFCFYLTKGLTTEVVAKDQAKFLGEKPVLSLPDSSGRSVNYFQENFYDEEFFAKSLSSIDRAIAVAPCDLSLRVDKITALLAYEKETPDLAVAELVSLIDENEATDPAWTYPDGTVCTDSEFLELVQENCWELYNIGSEASYNHFLAVSQKMNKLYPKECNFITNQGAYWLVVKHDYKKALKFYKKALKINPDDPVATANVALVERRIQQEKSAKKSLR